MFIKNMFNPYSNINKINYISKNLNKNFSHLSSGKKINCASDSPIDVYISSTLNSKIRGNKMAQKNIEHGLYFLETKESAIDTILSNTQRIKELSLTYRNDTLSNEEKRIIEDETYSLLFNIEEIKNNTDFNNINVFRGSSLNIQTGYEKNQCTKINQIGFCIQSNKNNTFNFYDLEPITINGRDTYQTVLKNFSMEEILQSDIIDRNITTPLIEHKSYIGIKTNELNRHFNMLKNQENINSSFLSSIEDVDIAKEVLEKSKNEILLNINSSLFMQSMDINKNLVFQLLR